MARYKELRYIDADALIGVLQEWRDPSSLNDGAGTPVGSILYDVIRHIEDAPTADVAPMVEVEALQEVNADLNESLRLAAEFNKDLQAEVKLWKGRAEAVFAAIPETRREFAREIFEEIEKIGIVTRATVRGEIIYNVSAEYTALKNKYTGGSNL